MVIYSSSKMIRYFIFVDGSYFKGKTWVRCFQLVGWSVNGCPVYLMSMNLSKSDLYNMLVKVHHDIKMSLDFISRVRQMKKFKIIVTFSSSNSQTKITWRVSCTIVCKVLKEPKVTFKHLKASLTSTNANVHEFIIRRTVNDNGVHVARRKPLLPKKNTAASLQCAKDHMEKPAGYWGKKWMDKISIKILIYIKNFMFKEEEKTLHSGNWILIYRWNMDEVVPYNPIYRNPVEMLCQQCMWGSPPTSYKLFCMDVYFSELICTTDQQLLEMFSCSYCCKRRSKSKALVTNRLNHFLIPHLLNLAPFIYVYVIYAKIL